MSPQLLREIREDTSGEVKLPAPTAWPIILAFGVTLVFAGLLTSASISILGAILALSGYIGWFCDVLPHEKHESVPVVGEVTPVVTSHPEVAQAEWITQGLHRARLPLEIYPISAGIKGGLAGGAAMAILAILYGVIGQHSIWYPVNLLAAGFFPGALETTRQIKAFHGSALMIATTIHLTTSLLVGLLYGAMLPMFPRRPILLGGVIAPIVWSGLLHGILDLLNPEVSQRINWFWFLISQVGFGIVAGVVVSRQERVRTWQHLPFAARSGMEVTGGIDEERQQGGRP